MKLKATKSSLYKLVAVYEHLPPMKQTQFEKAYRERSYWLEWSGSGVNYTAYLCPCLGEPLVAIKAKEYNEETGYYEITDIQTHMLTVQDLRERGMIDEENIERTKSFVKQKILVAETTRGLLQPKGNEEATQACRGQHLYNHLSENATIKRKKERHHSL